MIFGINAFEKYIPPMSSKKTGGKWHPVCYAISQLACVTTMIHEKDLYPLLSAELPGLVPEFSCLGTTGCPYKLAAFFSAYTKKQINESNANEARNCFILAELLIAKGDYVVSNAMANVFVFSVSNATRAAKYFTNEFPLLMKEYRRQLSSSSI